MKKTVYIETTIPSFYHEVRPEPEMVARRNWTREWWDHHGRNYNLVTSAPVMDELNRGHHPRQPDTLELITRLPILEVNAAVLGIVQVYIRHKLMPKNEAGDALHLALATHHECDFLLTWNCNHLANANKFGHIERIHNRLGLISPRLVTPLELLGE